MNRVFMRRKVLAWKEHGTHMRVLGAERRNRGHEHAEQTLRQHQLLQLVVAMYTHRGKANLSTKQGS
jgi:hypothetical protein